MPLRAVTPAIKAQYYQAGFWQDRMLFEYVDAHAGSRPDHVAIQAGKEQYTYRQVKSITDRLAMQFVRLGVGPGQIVAVQLPNRVELPLCHLALNKIGAVILPLSDSWRETELGYLLLRSEAVAVVIPGQVGAVNYPSLYEQLTLPHLRHRLCVDPGGGNSVLPFWGLINDTTDATVDPELLGSHRGDPDGFTFINVSSGTTSLPKCSQWTDNNIAAKLLVQYRQCSGIGSGDIAVAIAPAGTGATGYQYPILAPLLVGGTTVLLPKWQPSDALSLLYTASATMATVIPTQLVKMLADPQLETYQFTRLRCITNAGAPLAPEASRKAEAVFGCRMQTIYGATEGGVATMTALDDPPEKRYHTVGRPLPGEEVRILDEEGRDRPAGEAGEVTWRGCNKSLGYLNDTEGNRTVFWEDGWYLSGDIGIMDNKGYLRIVGRKKDMILRGGQNISPREIEELLLGHPNVKEVAVAGYPDLVLGERACAFVVPVAGQTVTLANLTEFLRTKQIAVWKLPERLELLNELPRSAGEKVVKSTLREMVVVKLRLEETEHRSGTN